VELYIYIENKNVGVKLVMVKYSFVKKPLGKFIKNTHVILLLLDLNKYVVVVLVTS